MMIQGVSIGDMVNQSVTALTKPGIATFEQFERRGGQREGLVYVGAAAAVSGIVALLAGVFTIGVVGGIVSGIAAAIIPVVGYYVSCLVVHYVGTTQGGTGTKDEVFYTFSLFLAPILAFNGIVGNIPLLACLALPATLALGIYQIYLGYLAVRSSMNLDQNKAIITMVVSWIIQVIALAIIGAIVGAVLVAVGATTGAIPVTPPTTP